MKITELALRRPSLIAVVFISLFILGLYGYMQLPVDLLPQMDFPYVQVTVPYPGAGPEDVERKVTKPLEDAMYSMNNVKSLQSYSQEGYSMLWIEFTMDTDKDWAVNEVQRQYNGVINELPVEVEPATIQQYKINDSPILQMSVTADLPPGELYQKVKNDLKPVLQQEEGVSRVAILGGKEREIKIELRPESMEAYGLSILQVMAALQADNRNVPVGKVEERGQNTVVRIKSLAADLQELEEIIVATTSAGPVHIGDIATVSDGFKDDKSRVYLNGQSCMGLLVFKRTGANTIETADRVLARTRQMEQNMGIKVEVAHNASDFINDSINGLQEELGLAIIIVALVIFLFLGNWRSSLIALISIPLSLISTLFFTKISGFSINIMSMMGAALVVGIVVDDSIVVLENIQHHIEKGLSPLDAALQSSREIGIAVVGISLTLVIVFLPVALVSGIAGRIFREFALVVVGSTLLSLLVAITLIPLLASRIHIETSKKSRSPLRIMLNLFSCLLDRLSSAYRGGIAWVLDHRAIVLILAILCLAGSTALIPLRMVGTEFMPKVDRGEFFLRLTAPPGVSLEKMDEIVRDIEDEITTLPGVKNTFTSIGYTTGMEDAGMSSNAGEILISLEGPAAANSQPIKDQVKAIAERRAGLESSILTTSLFGGANDADLRIYVKGYDIARLQEVTQTLRRIVADTPGTRDVRTTVERGLTEFNIRVDRDAAAAYNLMPGDVANAAGPFINGVVVSKFSDGNDQYDIRLIGEKSSREDTRQLSDMIIANQQGKQVRLGDVAYFSLNSSLKKINHAERQRFFSVSAIIDGRSLGDVAADVEQSLKGVEVPSDVTVSFAGDQQMFEDSMKDLIMAMLLSIIFVYLIMVALFESFLLPFSIWLSIPLAMVGAFVALAVTGDTLSIFSMVGLIMLVGLVTKNAILLVDCANELRKSGQDVRSALIDAGAARLRPILMTTVAMVLAMTPLAMGLSPGSELRKGMSVALIGGLISSTFLTLFVVPVVYHLLESLKERVQFRKTRPSVTINTGEN